MAVAFPAPGGAALPHRPRRPTDPSGGVRGEGPRHPTLPASAEGVLVVSGVPGGPRHVLEGLLLASAR